MRSPSRSRFAAPLVTAAALVLPRIVAAQSLRPFGNITLPQLIGRFVGGVLALFGTLALVMFIYAGFTWMTAGGNMEAVKKAKATLIYAVLGLIITMSAYFIVNEILFNVLVPQVIIPEGGTTLDQ